MDNIVTEKRCNKCGVTKPVEYFPRRIAGVGSGWNLSRWYSKCKTCAAEWAKSERGRESARKNRENNKEKMYAHRRTKVEEKREYDYRLKYGIGIGEYDKMFSAQSGVCAICGNEQGDGKRLCIDHDHKSGDIRGLLCYKCNHAIGKAEDNPQRLQKMIDYLISPPARKILP